MPEAHRPPVLWGIAAAVATVVAVVVVVAVRGGDDNGAGPDRDGLTRTEVDIDDPRSDPNTVRATVIADEGDRCVWLVDVAGADPGTRLIMAWPDGTQLEWDPFTMRIGGAGATITVGTPITASGELVGSDDELDDASFERLLGLFRCPYDGVFVADAATDSVVVRGAG